MGTLTASVTEAERRALDVDGYLHIPALLDQRQIGEVKSATPDAKPAGLDDPRLDCLWQHPRVLALISTVLGSDFHLQGFDRRTALVEGQPGRTCATKLHTDWHRGAEETFYQCVAIFPIDPFRPNNGATRVVPGSHRWTAAEWDGVDPAGVHPDEVRLVGKPGDAFILNAHVLHGAGMSLDGSPRRSIFAFYVRNDAPAYNVLPFAVSSDLRARLTPEANALLR